MLELRENLKMLGVETNNNKDLEMEKTVADLAERARYAEEVDRLFKVHDEKHYEVWVVKYKEMPAQIYGIINKDTGVIENFQPVLPNAKTLAKQFSEWLDGKDDDTAMLRAVTGGLN